MARVLPPEIVFRRKKGFGVPIGEWLLTKLRDLCDDLLSPARLGQSGIFDEQAVAKLISDHRSGRRDNRKQLWTLMVFSLWYNRWMK